MSAVFIDNDRFVESKVFGIFVDLGSAIFGRFPKFLANWPWIHERYEVLSRSRDFGEIGRSSNESESTLKLPSDRS
jgi:hypothetical protein